MFTTTVYGSSLNTAQVWTNSALLDSTVSFWDFVLLGISLFVIFSSILSIVFILWWGLLLILSGGKDDKIQPAINTIRYAVLGIVITVLTIFLFPIFGRLLGLDVEQYAQPARIFEKIEEIGDKIFAPDSYQAPIVTGDEVDDLDFPSNFSDL